MSKQIPRGTEVEGIMTQEQQRIAIAEACGWARNGSSGNDEYPWVKPVNGVAKSLPDYLNDLNACHDFEKTLVAGADNWRYIAALGDVVGTRLLSVYRRHTADGVLALITATAAQRAEAFLKTLNLYK